MSLLEANFEAVEFAHTTGALVEHGVDPRAAADESLSLWTDWEEIADATGMAFIEPDLYDLPDDIAPYIKCTVVNPDGFNWFSENKPNLYALLVTLPAISRTMLQAAAPSMDLPLPLGFTLNYCAADQIIPRHRDRQMAYGSIAVVATIQGSGDFELFPLDTPDSYSLDAPKIQPALIQPTTAGDVHTFRIGTTLMQSPPHSANCTSSEQRISLGIQI